MTLAIQLLRDSKRALLLFLAGIAFYAASVALSIPSILKNKEVYEGLLKAYPEELLKVIAGSNLKFSAIFSLEGSIAAYFTALWLPVILLGFYTTYFLHVISKDYEAGTIETLLSLPIKRSRIIFERGLAVTLTGFMISLFGMFVMYIVLIYSNVKVSFTQLLLSGIFAASFTLIFGMFELLLSAVFLEKSKPASITISTFIAMHLIESLSDLWKPLKTISKISLFHYYDAVSALKPDSFPLEKLILYLVASALMFIISILIFERKDVAVS